MVRVELDGAAQVGFRFLKASQLIESRTKAGMCLCVVWVLFGRDAVCVGRFRIPALPIQGIA